MGHLAGLACQRSWKTTSRCMGLEGDNHFTFICSRRMSLVLSEKLKGQQQACGLEGHGEHTSFWPAGRPQAGWWAGSYTLRMDSEMMELCLVAGNSRRERKTAAKCFLECGDRAWGDKNVTWRSHCGARGHPERVCDQPIALCFTEQPRRVETHQWRYRNAGVRAGWGREMGVCSLQGRQGCDSVSQSVAEMAKGSGRAGRQPQNRDLHPLGHGSGLCHLDLWGYMFS